ncbi:MAG: DUF2905 domain-containing protein [Tunicatimonas sp.]
MQTLGKFIIAAGLILVVIGLLVHFADRVPLLGRLPGDISIKKESFSFYFPLGTSILLSVIISLVLYLIRRFG